jgi:hypothetical protein
VRKYSYFSERDWTSSYEGLPNAGVVHISTTANDDSIEATIRLLDGSKVVRRVGGLQYVVGRRAELNYLSSQLQAELLKPSESSAANRQYPLEASLISGKTLRAQAESDTEVAPGVFVIGSMTGDSLVRHAFGGCVYAAGRIMGDTLKSAPPTPKLEGKADNVANGTAHEDLHLDRRKMVQSQ